MPTDYHLALAKRFVTALDRCDFAEAAHYLASDCHYQTGSEQLTGPEAIIASYRENAEWASRVLDKVIYESEVQEEEGGLNVLYTDRITHGGLTHRYSCRQHLTVNTEGKISSIVHEELPGEREKLDEFFRQYGVRR